MDEYENLKDIFIVDEEEVNDAKNTCDEDSSLKTKKKKKIHPKRYFFKVYVLWFYLFVRMWDLYVFSLGSWYLLFMFVACRHFIAKEGENEALVWEGLFHNCWRRIYELCKLGNKQNHKRRFLFCLWFWFVDFFQTRRSTIIFCFYVWFVFASFIVKEGQVSISRII